MLSPVLLILCSSTWRRALIIHKIDYRLSKLQRHKIQFDSILKTSNEFDYEPLLAAVRSIENADQDNDSQEVINITWNWSTCRANTNPYRYFEMGRWNWMEKITSYFNLHDLIRPKIWRRLRTKQSYSVRPIVFYKP